MLNLRATLDHELQHMSADLISLANKVDEAIDQAMLALEQKDSSTAVRVIYADDDIDQLRYIIEDRVLRLIATQQPIATDLRTAIATLHIATELERMADHASGIARIVERTVSEDPFDTLYKLPKMAKHARIMLNQGIKAYTEKDLDLAQQVIERDEKIDKKYRQLFKESLTDMRDEEYVRRGTFLLWAGHNMERIGDRAVNIAQRVIFMLTGEYPEQSNEETNPYPAQYLPPVSPSP